MTINKAQGQTLARVGVCLVRVVDDRDVDGTRRIHVASAESFSHGQVYVALSRSGDPDGVCMYTTYEQTMLDTIVNVVYPEALPLSIQTFAVEGMAILRSMSGLRTMEDYLSLLHTTGQAVQPATDMQVMVDTLPDEHFELDAPNFDHEGPSFEVPHHGYLFNEAQVHWDGAICSWRGLSEDEFLNSLMNDEFVDEYLGTGVFEDDMNYGISQAMPHI